MQRFQATFPHTVRREALGVDLPDLKKGVLLVLTPCLNFLDFHAILSYSSASHSTHFCLLLLCHHFERLHNSQQHLRDMSLHSYPGF